MMSTATQPDIIAELQARFGGTKTSATSLNDAVVAGQSANLYVVNGMVFCAKTDGPYTHQQIGLFVSVEMGLPLHMSHERAATEAGEPPAQTASNDNDRLQVINPSDWQDVPVPERLWYLKDLIPHRQVTILNGDGGVGKSLLSLQIAAAGAMQCETLDMRPMPGRVLYVGAEDEAGEFHRRLVDIVAAHQRELSDLVDFRLLSLADTDALLAVPDRAGVMQPTALWADLDKLAENFNPVLIVLDTAADLYGGDEIKRGQVRQFIAMLRHLAMRIDCAIVLLAHPSLQGIQSGSGSSGSTAWGNSVRSRLYLTSAAEKDADPDLRILTTKKANYSKVGGELRMRWQEGAFVVDDGKPSPASGILNKRTDEKFKQLLSTFNRTGQTVSDVSGSNYAPAKMSKHADAGGITSKQFAASMQRLLERGQVKIVVDGPDSRRRKRLILASEDFGSTRPSTSLPPPSTRPSTTTPSTPVGGGTATSRWKAGGISTT